MNNFEFLVVVNGETHYLDVTDVEVINIDYSISEISDISKRNSAYSRSIVLPDNDHNRYIFGFASNLASSGDIFNQNKKTKCYLILDSITVLEGYLQLTRCFNDPNTGASKFEVLVYAENSNFWTLLGESYLTDLDFTEYNHVYGTSSIIDSWTNNWGDGYFYGFGDFGYDFSLNRINGYESELKVKQFVPSTFVKSIFSKIFNSVDYSWDSEFINSDKFENLLIPFNGSNMTVDRTFIANNSFAVGRTQSQLIRATFSNPLYLDAGGFGPRTYGVYKHTIKLNNENAPYSDPASAWSGLSFSWTNTTNGLISLGFYIDLDITLDWCYPGSTISYYDLFNLSGPTVSQVDFAQSIGIYRSMHPITGALDPYFDEETDPYIGTYGPQYPCPIWEGGQKYLDLWTYANERRQVGTSSFGGTATYPNVNFRVSRFTEKLDNRTQYAVYATGSGTYSLNTNAFIEARPGERFKLFLRRAYAGYDHPSISPVSATINSLVGTSSYMASNISTNPWLGAPIDYNSVLPKKIKQKDFISSIIKMFNLYVEPSREKPNTLIIEPREDYYGLGIIRDWTDKLDRNFEIIKLPTSNLIAKENIFTYKPDSDWYNEDYSAKTNDTYGQFVYYVDNDFSQESDTIDIIFSPTPMSNVRGSSNIIVPKIFKTSNRVGDGSVTRYDFNPRILTKTTGGTVSTGIENLKFEGINFKYYPYIGHLDHPFEPTYDLNFGEAIDQYNGNVFGWDNYAIPVVRNTLYNQYYSKMMDEYSNSASKIVECYLYLTPDDIYNFRFNDTIFLRIEGVENYYKINKISAYDPTTRRSTKVELLKTFYTPTVKNINSDGGTYQSYEGTPIVIMPPSPPVLSGFVSGQGNQVSSGENIVVGSGNTVGSSGNLITGQGNIVGGGSGMFVGGAGNNIQQSSNIISIGNGNTVESTDSGVFNIGSCNVITNASKGFIMGSGNEILNESKTFIFGDLNKSACSTQPTFIMGSSNSVATQSNAFIFGSNNIISTTSSNIVVFGNNITATQANTVYFENIVVTGTASMGDVGENQIAFGQSGNLVGSGNLTFDSIYTNFNSGANYPFTTPTTYSSMIGGSGNLIIGYSNYAVIVGGFRNENCNSKGSIIGSFCSTIRNGGAYLSIIGGKYNTMNDISSYSSIIGGAYNTLGTSYQSAIIGGYHNQIGTSSNSFIGGGYDNIIKSTGVYSTNNNSIIGGYSNRINNTVTNLSMVIIGGNGNNISDSNFSNIHGGVQSNINNGNGNNITGGNGNNIHNSLNSSIISSNLSSVTQSFISSIFSSYTSIINDSFQSAIIGGYQNQIGTSSNSVIIGGSNLSLTFSSNTVLVPKLKIDSITYSSTATKVLVWDDDKNIKYNDSISDAIGSVKMFYPISGTFGTYFDPSTGLGRTSTQWSGWAVADGRNGTPDLRGRIPFGYNDTGNTSNSGNDNATASNFRTLGATGGSRLLSNSTIPPHRHLIVLANSETGTESHTGVQSEITSDGLDITNLTRQGRMTGEQWNGGGGTVGMALLSANSGDGTSNNSNQSEIGNASGSSDPYYQPYNTLIYVIKIT